MPTKKNLRKSHCNHYFSSSALPYPFLNDHLQSLFLSSLNSLSLLPNPTPNRISRDPRPDREGKTLAIPQQPSRSPPRTSPLSPSSKPSAPLSPDRERVRLPCPPGLPPRFGQVGRQRPVLLHIFGELYRLYCDPQPTRSDHGPRPPLRRTPYKVNYLTDYRPKLIIYPKFSSQSRLQTRERLQG